MALARKYDVPLDWLTLGSGSNDILEFAAAAVLAPGASTVYAQHSFAVYAIATQARGGRHIVVPARDFGHDLDAMLAAIAPDTRLLYIANLLWTVAYDTYYAMTDREDDLKIGVKSTAILFGDADRLIIAILQGLALLCLLLAGNRFELGTCFHLGLVAAAACFAWEFHSTRSRDPQACFKAFLHNHWAGLAILAGIVADYALR